MIQWLLERRVLISYKHIQKYLNMEISAISFKLVLIWRCRRGGVPIKQDGHMLRIVKARWPVRGGLLYHVSAFVHVWNPPPEKVWHEREWGDFLSSVPVFQAMLMCLHVPIVWIYRSSYKHGCYMYFRRLLETKVPMLFWGFPAEKWTSRGKYILGQVF